MGKQLGHGNGFVIKSGDSMKAYGVNHGTAACPLQAEARALLEAVRYVTENVQENCVFCTDNAMLANAVSRLQPPIEVDWRAAREIRTL